MEEREQKIVLEKFLSFHGIDMLPWARLPAYARRFRRFFPSIASAVNPEMKPWIAPLVARLADHVAGLNPADFSKDGAARPFHVAKKHRKMNRTKAFIFGWEWRQLRYEVFKERGARCELCGATRRDDRIEVDHIEPLSKHWEKRLDKTNLQVLCRACNKGKGNRHSDDFRSDQFIDRPQISASLAE